MMTSSNGNIFRVTGPLCGEFTGPGGFPAQRPVTRSFDVFFDLSPNKRLSKQPWGWWFETPSCLLWRQCNVYDLCWHGPLLPDSSFPNHPSVRQSVEKNNWLQRRKIWMLGRTHPKAKIYADSDLSRWLSGAIPFLFFRIAKSGKKWHAS